MESYLDEFRFQKPLDDVHLLKLMMEAREGLNLVVDCSGGMLVRLKGCYEHFLHVVAVVVGNDDMTDRNNQSY